MRSDHPRIAPILGWMKRDCTEKNDFIMRGGDNTHVPGFTQETPMTKKIKLFCEEHSHMWTEASKLPHAQRLHNIFM